MTRIESFGYKTPLPFRVIQEHKSDMAKIHSRTRFFRSLFITIRQMVQVVLLHMD